MDLNRKRSINETQTAKKDLMFNIFNHDPILYLLQQQNDMLIKNV